jgi:hypothetical protein
VFIICLCHTGRFIKLLYLWRRCCTALQYVAIKESLFQSIIHMHYIMDSLRPVQCCENSQSRYTPWKRGYDVTPNIVYLDVWLAPWSLNFFTALVILRILFSNMSVRQKWRTSKQRNIIDILYAINKEKYYPKNNDRHKNLDFYIREYYNIMILWYRTGNI